MGLAVGVGGWLGGGLGGWVIGWKGMEAKTHPHLATEPSQHQLRKPGKLQRGIVSRRIGHISPGAASAPGGARKAHPKPAPELKAAGSQPKPRQSIQHVLK